MPVFFLRVSIAQQSRNSGRLRWTKREANHEYAGDCLLLSLARNEHPELLAPNLQDVYTKQIKSCNTARGDGEAATPSGSAEALILSHPSEQSKLHGLNAVKWRMHRHTPLTFYHA